MVAIADADDNAADRLVAAPARSHLPVQFSAAS
jgi:hypothetical protein